MAWSFWEGSNGTRSIPPHDVYRRVLIRIGPEEIETCFMNWVRTIKNKYEREIAD
ncbi:MAG: transposase family protein [Treponema sp.]|nr:transposase family protein [Treponema sp.]